MEVKIVELTEAKSPGTSPSTQVICDLKGYLRPNVSVGLCPGKGDSDYTGKQQIQLVNNR